MFADCDSLADVAAAAQAFPEAAAADFAGFAGFVQQSGGQAGDRSTLSRAAGSRLAAAAIHCETETVLDPPKLGAAAEVLPLGAASSALMLAGGFAPLENS